MPSHLRLLALVSVFAAVTAARRTRKEQSETATHEATPQHEGREVIIKAYWIRHGQSCANIIKNFWMYRDPSLTNCAIARAEVQGPQIWAKIIQDNPESGSPLVFTSAMVRTMETALHSFNRPLDHFPNGYPEALKEYAFSDHHYPPLIHPIPYIAEQNKLGFMERVVVDSPDNIALSWEDQMAKKLHRANTNGTGVSLNELNTEAMLERIRFSPEVNPSNHPDRSNRKKSWYDRFLQKFSWAVAQLVPDGDDRIEIPVVIVGHSQYMRHHLDCWDRKPKNSEVWMRKYKVNLPSKADAASWTLADTGGGVLPYWRQKLAHTMQHVPDSCEKIFDDDFWHPDPPHQCTEGMDRCSKSNRPSEDKKCADIPAAARVCGGGYPAAQ